jgi:hypothetical protein
MTELELLVNENRRAIEEVQARNAVLAEALASHASVIRMMAVQIKDIANQLDFDIDPPRMM